MKANQTAIKNATNDRAEVGVGTLIVFIAMVLVAAVAAAVLINTSGTLQQRAGQTGKEATQEVSSNLKVEGIFGARNYSATGPLASTIDNVSIHVALQSGAVPIDLNQLIVRFSDGTNVREMNFSDENPDTLYNDTTDNTFESRFNVTSLRDSDSSFSGSSPVVTAGDLVKLTIYKVSLSVRTPVTITLIPEAGAKIPADFVTPPTYGTKQNIVLR